MQMTGSFPMVWTGSPLAVSSTWAPSPLPLPRFVGHHTRKIIAMRCFVEQSKGAKEGVCRNVLANIAAAIILTTANQVIAAEFSQNNSICHLASSTEQSSIMAFDKAIDNENGSLMMSGMTAKNFNPIRYSGRWFEVASLKRGFAGQGQQDCHCTQGVYTFDADNRAIQVDTFCVHGSPDGYITGIRGKVQCVGDAELEKEETEVERKEMIKEKCYLRFPTLPFIPKEPYDVIATDYDNFALVSGAKDKSFVQEEGSKIRRTRCTPSCYIEGFASWYMAFATLKWKLVTSKLRLVTLLNLFTDT
eukprot:Gb_16780 [translate_table: standard]